MAALEESIAAVKGKQDGKAAKKKPAAKKRQAKAEESAAKNVPAPKPKSAK